MTCLCLFQDGFYAFLWKASLAYWKHLPKSKLAGLTATVKKCSEQRYSSIWVCFTLLRSLQTETDQTATFHHDMLIEILRPHSLFKGVCGFQLSYTQLRKKKNTTLWEKKGPKV